MYYYLTFVILYIKYSYFIRTIYTQLYDFKLLIKNPKKKGTALSDPYMRP